MGTVSWWFVQFSVPRFFVRRGRLTVHLICLGHKYIHRVDCKVLNPDVYTIFLKILNFDTFLVKSFSNFASVSYSNDFLNLVKVILKSYYRFQKSNKNFFHCRMLNLRSKLHWYRSSWGNQPNMNLCNNLALIIFNEKIISCNFSTAIWLMDLRLKFNKNILSLLNL